MVSLLTSGCFVWVRCPAEGQKIRKGGFVYEHPGVCLRVTSSLTFHTGSAHTRLAILVILSPSQKHLFRNDLKGKC